MYVVCFTHVSQMGHGSKKCDAELMLNSLLDGKKIDKQYCLHANKASNMVCNIYHDSKTCKVHFCQEGNKIQEICP